MGVFGITDLGDGDQDADDRPMAQMKEDRAGLALLRRFLNFIPQTFRLDAESGGHRAIMCGDLFHHALQIPEPRLNSIFCEDPALSAKTRTEFVERHVDTDTLILPAHFPGETAGRIRDVAGEWRFQFDE